MLRRTVSTPTLSKNTLFGSCSPSFNSPSASKFSMKFSSLDSNTNNSNCSNSPQLPLPQTLFTSDIARHPTSPASSSSSSSSPLTRLLVVFLAVFVGSSYFVQATTTSQVNNQPNQPIQTLFRRSANKILSLTSFPAAGGVDILREADYRIDSIVDSIVYVVRGGDGEGRGKFLGSALFRPTQQQQQQPVDEISLARRFYQPNISKFPTILGASSSPFTIDVSSLLLPNIASAFEHAINSNRARVKRKETAATPLKDAMDRAIGTSRGNCSPALTTSEFATLPGDVDSLQFCTVMRMFADWRILRQVPPGYKGYYVGMQLGLKDVVNNIAKIESAIRGYHEFAKQSTEGAKDNGNANDNGNENRTPTLKQLLKVEHNSNYHQNDRLPKLRDNSAAIGVLWLSRQLKFQATIYENLLDHDHEHDQSTIGAVVAAYETVYGQFHAWATRQIFGLSFQGAPEKKAIYRFQNPIAANSGYTDEELETLALSEMKSFLNVVKPLLINVDELLDEFNMHDLTKV